MKKTNRGVRFLYTLDTPYNPVYTLRMTTRTTHMHLLICAIATIAFSICSCATQVSSTYIPVEMDGIEQVSFSDTDFIKVKGQQLTTPDGDVFFIKGMAFGNQVWGNVTEAPAKHHTAESYAEIARLGFNTVRFYINYQLFEDDSRPGKYRNTGFDWLNKNIQWAKENGIRLIVNMHVPQGGFQSNGDGLQLFSKRQNQIRLVTLWREIARYYKDCSTIIGWGLVNEPNVPFDTNAATSLQAWNALAKDIVAAIREVDKNHIVFAECAIGVISMVDGNKRYHQFNREDAFPVIDDDNLVYEFHSYEPLSFTHQGANWIDSLRDTTMYYPNPNHIAIDYKEWLCEKQTRFVDTDAGLSSEWTCYTYSLADWTDTKATIFNATVKPSLLGEKGHLFIDDVEILRSDATGSAKTICSYAFNDGAVWAFGSGDESGSVIFNSTQGRGGSGCMEVSGTETWAWLSGPDQIPLEEGCVYTIRFWAKMDGIPVESYASFGVDLAYADIKTGFDKSDLWETIEQTMNLKILRNRPVFVGEFGCIRNCFANNLGATQYITDSVELFRKRTCGYNYHTYHEYSFGLHSSNPETTLPSDGDLNMELQDLFITLQTKSQPQGDRH